MRYAIISDVHGNFTALNAVLADCAGQSIDQYLFLGDYYGEFPMHNEVLSTIRSMDNARVIRGNREERLIAHKDMQPHERTSEQFAPLYWILNNLHACYYQYIESLPAKISFSVGAVNCFMAHSPSQHFGYGAADRVCGRVFSDQYGKAYSSHAGYLAYIECALQRDRAFMEGLLQLPEGVYLFGHYHTQWYAHLGGYLLINPGSCGLPLDFDTSAPYTILDSSNGFSVIERRVNYDITVPVSILKESECYAVAPFWNSLCILEFENAKTAVMPFLEFVEALAQMRHDKDRPYSNELWREAISMYTQNHHVAYPAL